MKHARLKGKELTLSSVQTMMANSRSTVEEAYPGDVIGVANPAGTFAIGDTIYTGSKRISYSKIPSFSPEVRAAWRGVLWGCSISHSISRGADRTAGSLAPRPSPLTPNHDIRHAPPAPPLPRSLRAASTPPPPSPSSSPRASRSCSTRVPCSSCAREATRAVAVRARLSNPRVPLEPTRATRRD